MFKELENDRYELQLPRWMEVAELSFDSPSPDICCGMGADHIVIKHDGTLASCPMTVHEHTVVPEDDLFEAAARTFLDSPAGRPADDVCLACQWYRVCAGLPCGQPKNQGFALYSITPLPFLEVCHAQISRLLRNEATPNARPETTSALERNWAARSHRHSPCRLTSFQPKFLESAMEKNPANPDKFESLDALTLTGSEFASDDPATLTIETQGGHFKVRQSDVLHTAKAADGSLIVRIPRDAKVIYETVVYPEEAESILAQRAGVELVGFRRRPVSNVLAVLAASASAAAASRSGAACVECSRCTSGECECSRCVEIRRGLCRMLSLY